MRLTNNPFTADSGAHGVGDTGLGFKYRVTQDSGYKPSIALMYMAKLPTAGDVPGSGEADHAFTLLVSKDLGKHHFDFNLIANLLGRPQGGFDRSYLSALAWSHPIRGTLGATAEFSGTTSPNPLTPARAQFLAAGTYGVRPRFVVDLGMAARITGNIPDAMFIAGVTYSNYRPIPAPWKERDSRSVKGRKNNDFLMTCYTDVLAKLPQRMTHASFPRITFSSGCAARLESCCRAETLRSGN